MGVGMTENPEPIDWDALRRQAVEKTLRERDRRRTERQQFATRRQYGLAARHKQKLARINQEKAMKTCRYLDRFAVQCTAEAADPNGEVLLCTNHMGRVIELLKNRWGFTITAPAASWCDDCKEN
jgi:hypothetical protein